MDSRERLQYIYRMQQSKLIHISHLVNCFADISNNLTLLCSGQKVLAEEMQDCTNQSGLLIGRLERKQHKDKVPDDDEAISLSPARRKSLTAALRKLNDASASAARSAYRYSDNHKYAAEQLDLSVITIKHFLWREQIFMAVILGDYETDILKELNVSTCALGRWLEGKGKRSCSHLPAYHSLGKAHTHYHEMVGEIVSKGIEGREFGELSEDLTRLELVSQQIVACIIRIQAHVELLAGLNPVDEGALRKTSEV